MESGGGESVCKGKEDNTEALTSGESNKVTSFSFSRVCQETRHLDEEKEGGGAANADGFNGIGEIAVGGKETREIFD